MKEDPAISTTLVEDKLICNLQDKGAIVLNRDSTLCHPVLGRKSDKAIALPGEIRSGFLEIYVQQILIGIHPVQRAREQNPAVSAVDPESDLGERRKGLKEALDFLNPFRDSELLIQRAASLLFLDYAGRDGSQANP